MANVVAINVATGAREDASIMNNHKNHLVCYVLIALWIMLMILIADNVFAACDSPDVELPNSGGCKRNAPNKNTRADSHDWLTDIETLMSGDIDNTGNIKTDRVGPTELDRTADYDFNAGTIEIPNSTSLPGTCDVGDIYMDTNATSGQRLYLCESTNTWALQGGGADTTLSEEQVEDFAGGMLGGTETFVDVTYQDSTNDIDFVVPVKDEDTMSSNSATHLATQQSIKAYVDAEAVSHTDGANCASGEIPLGVDANGAVQGCYQPTEADITDLSHTTNTNANTVCSGTTTYMDGEGNCDDISAVYEGVDSDLAKINESEAITGDWDVGGGTLQIPNSTTLPGTCEVGDMYMDTNATSGQRFYLCESTNTWTIQGDGSGAGGHGNGANCAAGEIPRGVDANGAVEGCYEPTEADITDLAHTTDTNLTEEEVEDFVGGMLGGTETFITATYEDSTNDIDFVVPVKDEDAMGSDSATHLATQQSIKAYVDAQDHSGGATLTEEQVEDFAGSMLGGTETFVSVTYEDSTNDIDFVVPVKDEDAMGSDSATHLATQQSIKAYVDGKDHTDTNLTEEEVEDFVGGMLGGTETFITATYEDSTNDIDFVVPVKDEDAMGSDSATHLATQQSIKAYVDAAAADTSANTICSGTTTYLDGEGNCDDREDFYLTGSQIALGTTTTGSGFKTTIGNSDLANSKHLQLYTTRDYSQGLALEYRFETSGTGANNDILHWTEYWIKDTSGTMRNIGTTYLQCADLDTTDGDNIDCSHKWGSTSNGTTVTHYANLSPAGVWTDHSDASGKDYEGPYLDYWPGGVVAKLKNLTLQRYTAKGIDTTDPYVERHFSPHAEEWHEQFGLGTWSEVPIDPGNIALGFTDEKEITSIAAKDLAGVALAAILELDARVEELEASVVTLVARVAELEAE